MAFIQIIELHTSDIATVTKMGEEWEHATEGRRSAQRSVVVQDRNDPTRHLNIVFFDSYEDAMKNSNLPETQAFAEQLAAAVDGPIVFHDLDVIEDRVG